MWRAIAVWSLVVGVTLGVETFTCPENEITGKFADPDECDKYWDCFKGTATPVYCRDGWAFDPNLVVKANPCDYIFKVDCTGREILGEPQGTGVCVRQNGVYPHDDPNVCGKYYTCTDNVPTLLLCSPGLHFNTRTNTCDWPASARRGACDARRTLDGFTCDPTKEYFTADNQKIVHPNFAHPENCSLFYVCKNGIEPAISGCDEGLVFSEAISACDVPENVPECNPDYEYSDYPDSADALSSN
ncbi:protein obstructor-E-like [Pollicipes pollicipes]|uniref:protein obstructor-E-like n=1 Tax=Pollicipes pollicipes TaxID=41117 RepID=UPI0018853072|nr:protein obstructor-E-like [Pollicipes pollicipes]